MREPSSTARTRLDSPTAPIRAPNRDIDDRSLTRARCRLSRPSNRGWRPRAASRRGLPRSRDRLTRGRSDASRFGNRGRLHRTRVSRWFLGLGTACMRIAFGPDATGTGVKPLPAAVAALRVQATASRAPSSEPEPEDVDRRADEQSRGAFRTVSGQRSTSSTSRPRSR